MLIKANAYAKINLTLDVTGKHENGYHEIESIMQTISLHDTLSVQVDQTSAENKISINCDKLSLLCKDEENICFRACEAFLGKYGIKGYNINISIEKRIPIAAGLGGGSSDGAETIKALNSIFGIGASDEELQSLAATVGADVPFFIRGGTQLAGGIGEILTPVNLFQKKYVVLAKPAMSLFSGNVYSMFDSLTGSAEQAMSQRFLEAADNGKPVEPYTNNMLARAVCSQPGTEIIGELERFMRSCGAECAHMTGSGPTVYGIFSDYADAVVVMSMIKQNMRNIEFCDVCEMYNVK